MEIERNDVEVNIQPWTLRQGSLTPPHKGGGRGGQGGGTLTKGGGARGLWANTLQPCCGFTYFFTFFVRSTRFSVCGAQKKF